MALVGTYDGLVRAVDGLVRVGCCCATCDPANKPMADFSYEQIDDDPCTITLSDDSTVHENCEGSIVERKWYKNGVQFSTASNPTVEVEDGDVIRLWVKDACGCTDDVEGEIECEEFHTCANCPPGPKITTITAVVNGATHLLVCFCDAVDGKVFTLGGSQCQWGGDLLLPPCQVSGQYLLSRVSVTIYPTYIEGLLLMYDGSPGPPPGPGQWEYFRVSRSPGSPCTGTFTLTHHSGFSCSGETMTVTI